MTLPIILIGFVFASLYGSVFHVFRGGGFWRLLYYIVLAWIGFWIGHYVGNNFGMTIGSLGPLRLGAATIGAVIVLGIGYWLSLINPENE